MDEIVLRINDSERQAGQLSTLAHSLCIKSWAAKNLDTELRQTLNSCLPLLGAVGVIAHFADEQVTLRHFLASLPPPLSAQAAIAKRVDDDFRLGALRRVDYEMPTVDGYHIVAREVPSARGTARPAGYSALIYQDDDKLDSRVREKHDTFHANSTVGLLFQVLQHRVRIFSPFAARVAERYWDESLSTAPDRLKAPWEHSDSLKTATLSIDLRKSTFCMENAADPKKFARWLDELVQILTAVTHLYGGVFDKFTGDGALVHFLERESALIYNTTPVEAALDCAISMHRAVARHLEQLRKFLRLDSDILGAAIGIDVDPTYWSVDHRNNPITVGRGVVNACRVGDKTDAGAIRITNIAYQLLPRTRDLAEFTKVKFVSKEYGAEMHITAWELPHGAHPLVRFPAETDAIVEQVYRRSVTS
jgi:class 3 adenylate cyclase